MPACTHTDIESGATHFMFEHVWHAPQSVSAAHGLPTHSVFAMSHVSPGKQSAVEAQ